MTLGPHITNENVQVVYNAVYMAMLQSVSLLKEYDTPSIEQRASLFSALLNYLLTRFESFQFTETRFASLKQQLDSEIFVKHINIRKERFSPSFIAILLILYDLCKINHMEDPFKQIIYSIFKMSGEFPLQVVYTLWKHDHDVFAETSLYDTIINNIIGYIFTTNRDKLQPYHDMVEWYSSINASWDEKLSEIEASALQCVLNTEAFTQENVDVFTVAGKSLALLYVYRGGVYAIQSLKVNGILERIDDSAFDSKYRLFLVYIICSVLFYLSFVVWCAESSLFGAEWYSIRDVILSLNLITDEVRQEFLTLFAYRCLIYKNNTHTYTILPIIIPAITSFGFCC